MNGTMIEKVNRGGEALAKAAIDGNKRLLRDRCKAIYADLSTERVRESSVSIARRVVDMPEFQAARTIFCYVSCGREVATEEIIAAALNAGKRVCVPLCRGEGIMDAREFALGDELIEGAFGIREPLESAAIIPRDEIDFAVVPCIACDKRRGRLGHGGGYYDRFLEGRKMYKVALCHDELIFGAVPAYKTDVQMDCICTASEIY